MKKSHDPPASLFGQLNRLQPSEPVILGGAAVLVGLLGGIGVWLFKQLILLFHYFAFGKLGASFQAIGPWLIPLVPVLGGLLVGTIKHYWIGVERHHGVAGIIEAAALAGGRLRYHRMPAKTLAASVSIGFGASVGPEDPSVQVGANLGSMFGQVLHLSDERVRALVAAGAAAGISAAFNAPITGVFFALEIILGVISGASLGIILIASIVSAVFIQAVSGPDPAFAVPAYEIKSYWELPLFLLLGLLAGPSSALYIRMLYWFQDLFHSWHAPEWVKPAAAGLLVGLVGIFLPQIFGVGYDTIEQTLNGQTLGIGLLLALMVAKLILTPVSIGGGFLGGVFAPALFIGAMLGGAYGEIAQRLFPTLPIVPGAYAMVGMAAVLAGAVHAPLTAILLFFEMTNDYRIILPVMLAVAVSLLVSQRLQRDSVYALGLARKGIRLDRGRDVELMEGITVGEVMQTDFITLNETDSLEVASHVFMESRHHGLAVINDVDELIGILTVQDLDRAATGENPAQSVGRVCTRQPLVAYPDETMGVALRRMGTRDIGRLPVVARENSQRLVGILSRTDIVRAYDIALSRRAMLRHRAHQVHLGAVRGDPVSVIELEIEAGSACANQPVQEIAWPRDCIISSLRRRGRLIIPHGDTLLLPGDVLVVVAEGPAIQQAVQLCKRASTDNG